MQSNHSFEFEAGSTHMEEDLPMNCDQVWDLLSVYADGETNPHETTMVEDHIASCESCAADLAFLQSTSVSLRDVPEVEPPASLRHAILAATVNRPTWQDRLAAAARRTLVPAPLRYGALAAAGAAAALTFVMIHDGGVQLNNPVEYKPSAPAVAEVRTQPQLNTAISMPPAHPLSGAPTRTIGTFARTTSQRSNSTLATVRLASAASPSAKNGALKPRPETAAPITVSPAFKLKVQDPGTNGGDFNDAPPVVASTPANTVDSHGPETLVGSAPVDESLGSQKGSRIILASSTTVDAGGVATLADLRRSLKDQESKVSASELRQRMRDHQIRIDVIKGSF